jgi:hypothetical protein
MVVAVMATTMPAAAGGDCCVGADAGGVRGDSSAARQRGAAGTAVQYGAAMRCDIIGF